MRKEMNKYLLDNAADGDFVVIIECADEPCVICKNGRFSFELEDAIAIRDDHRDVYKDDAEVNVYMVQHGMDDYGQIINELIMFE